MAKKSILINVGLGEVRAALIENGIIAELYVERSHDENPVGNIYLGRVTRVLPGMQAAFIDIGLERAAFLHVEDVIPAGDFEQMFGADHSDDDEASENGGSKPQRLTRSTPIRDVLKEGDSLMVQVAKEPIGTKGARVTGHISLPGRYVVYMPTVDQIGVSKRIGNDRERKRLKGVIEEMKPEQGGLIVRTVASGLTKGQLRADIQYLVSMWNETMQKRDKAKKAPVLLYQELDLVLRAVRDLMSDDVDHIVIDQDEHYHRLVSFVQASMPERAKIVELYKGNEPMFDEYGLEDEITRALARKVSLPSGGYLIIDQAEALTAIDVNTGRFTGKGKDVEETILQTNLEAAREISYQLRFRNIGGLIVLDFIDMDKPSHREKVYRGLVEALKEDRSKTTTVRISELGLVEMTRKRTRDSLSRSLYEPCFYCDGTGHVLSRSSVCHEIFRQIDREKNSLPGYKIVVQAHPAVCDRMMREEKDGLDKAQNIYSRQIVMQPRKDYHMEQFDLTGAS